MGIPYTALADFVVAIHFAFVVFVLLGGILTLKWTRSAWAHIPAAVWGVLIEFAGWVCPLTPLENWLREKGGNAGYRESFVEHYLEPILYPASLPRSRQIMFGVLALAINIVVYGYAVWRSRSQKFRREEVDETNIDPRC